jgi:hypothetical protein
MGDLYYLSLRDIASSSTGVTAAQVYRLRDVAAGTIWPLARLTGADWVPWDQSPQVFRGKRVCFVVHGFNVNVDHGVKGGGPTAQEFEDLGTLAMRMTDADLVIPVLWPGDGFIVTSWFKAIDHVNSAGARFAEFLVSSAFQASEVSFLTHSLGARLMLEAVRHTLGKRPTYPFDTAVMMAAAVADNTLDNKRYADAVRGLRRIVVLSSTKDTVLSGVFVAGDIIENALWWDYGGNGRALGRFGPAFKPDSPFPAKTEWYAIRPGMGQNHGDYLPNGWEVKPGAPNGWAPKQVAVGRFVEDLVDIHDFPDAADDWATDNTARFRKDWTPKLPSG